jgi:autophagy-related protein 2
MKRFCDNAFKFAKLQIRIELPIVSLQLKTKHFYEVIYNRIISDILMWESSVPKVTAKPPEVALSLKKPPESLMQSTMMESMYVPCKSTMHFESSSSATNSESESDNDPVFYSVYERNKARNVLPIYQTDYSSACALELNIGKGIISLYAPVRDAQNHVLPGQLGEFALKAGGTSIFSVSTYHGNTNLNYLCVQTNGLEMYHCGLLPVPIQNPPLRDVNWSLPAWTNATLYPTPRNLSLSESHGSSKRDMLALAIQIKTNPDQGLKRIKVSVGIQNTTLRYMPSLSEHLWLTQLMDMFDVKEDIVPGYTPYTNLTELHLHLWDCSIDYRPLKYPFRAIATLGNLMISSNLAAESVGCTLRFVAEDVTLSLAPQVINDEPQECNKITALPGNELICVGELGLFEISLKLSEKVTSLSPKFDLRAAIKDVHIRTCSDSGKALLEFISYLTSDGDLYDANRMADDESETSSIMQTNDDELLQIKKSTNDIPEVTETQQKHVNTLMADAMEESIYIPSGSGVGGGHSGSDEEIVDLGSEVFFFPDEQKRAGIRKSDSYKRRYASEDSISMDSSSYREDEEVFVRRYEAKEEDAGSVNTEMRELLDFESSVMIRMKEPEDFDPLPQVEMDLGDISKYEVETPPKRATEVRKKHYSDSDDDFCIVADEERPTYNQDIQVLQSDDPIRIVDNHFSAPHGKPDLLKAPSDFPMAVQRYTLCEMTLVWHLYGGRDFDENDKRKEREEKEEM